MCKYSLETIRKKAYKIGYRVSKGFQRYHNGGLWRDWNGVPRTGYNVVDLSQNILVWDCYDSNYDHLWTLEDVEK